MAQSKYIIAAFLGFIIFVSIEVIEVGGKFRSGRFRFGGFRTRSSSRRAPSIYTSKPSYSFNSNRNLESWRSSSAVVTSKPTYNSNRNGDGWYDGSNNHNSHRIFSWENPVHVTPKPLPARFQTTPKNNVLQVRTTSKPNYNSNGNSYGWNDGSNNYNSNRGGTAEKPGAPKLPPGRIPTTPRNYAQHNSSNYFENNYANSYYNDKNSGTTNALIAGLGGSALGMYLGYQLHNMNRDLYPTYNLDSNKFYPQYSVVHYYHHGDRPIVKDVKVNDNIIKECVNITFCTPNTQPLCLTNGTIYCLAPISAVKRCNDNTTNSVCLNTTLTAPCLNAPYNNCNTTDPLGNITTQIPCVTNLHVYGDFGTGKLKVHQTTSDGNITSESSHNQGTINEFCVTVIADPIRQQKEMTNAQFMRYLMKNDKEYQTLKVKLEQTLEKLLSL